MFRMKLLKGCLKVASSENVDTQLIRCRSYICRWLGEFIYGSKECFRRAVGISNSRREVGGGIKGRPVFKQMVFICRRVNSKTSFPVETLEESTSNIHRTQE